MSDEPLNMADLTEERWTFVLFDSAQWHAWKRYEVKDGRRWAFRYQDPKGRGVGCDVPREWPPGHINNKYPAAKEPTITLPATAWKRRYPTTEDD